MDNTVWIITIVTLLGVSILLTIFDKFSPHSFQNIKQEDEYVSIENRIFNIKESLWFCFTSLTAQGGGAVPKMVSGQILGATWWTFGFVFVASFTANLAAFLTVGRLESGVNSLEDLVVRPSIS